MKALRTIELLLLALGVLGIAIYLFARIHGTRSARAALAKFEAIPSTPPRGVDPDSAKVSLPEPTAVDFSLWSPKRVLDYRHALIQSFDAPLAVLKIPAIHLEVLVFDGTDELILNRGVGRIIGTSKPGQPGNIGVAGHRDGFLRGLKDIGVGEEVELVTAQGGGEKYFVDHIRIVTPEDVSILSDRGFPSLTIVTCYPFYFIGDAPKRYIVQCSFKERRID